LNYGLHSPEGTHTYGPTVPQSHSPEGTQAFSRQPGLAVPGTIDSESSEGAQAENALPTAPSTKTIPPRTLPARQATTSRSANRKASTPQTIQTSPYRARTQWPQRVLKIGWHLELWAPQSRRDAGVGLHSPEGTHTYRFHSPEGTQAFSRQPGLAVPSTIDSESSEGAQADHASPTAPSTKTIPPRTLPARQATISSKNPLAETISEDCLAI